MFDVIWTDHDRQLQGEHRAKKEAAAAAATKDSGPSKKKPQQSRSSLSTKRSSVSSGNSPLSSFFRGHGLKRINTTSDADANSRTRSTNSSRLASPSPLATSFDGGRSNNSPRSSGTGSRPAGAAVVATTGKCSGEQGRGHGSVEDERSVDLSRHGSVFSKYAESDNVTSYSTGDSSFSDRHRSLGKTAVPQKLDTQPIYEHATWPRSTKKLVRPTAAPLSASLVPGSLLPARPKHPTVRSVNLDTWQTPDLWCASFEELDINLQPTIEVLTSMLEDSSMSRKGQSWDVEEWKKEVDAMSKMRLDDIVLSLQSIWTFSQRDDHAQDDDSNDEAEEMRWMLWALKHLDREPEPLPAKEPQTEENDPLLILYDSQEIASYLAATTSSSEIHHVSTHHPSFNQQSSPDAPKSLVVDSLRPSDLSFETKYRTITTLTLPSLVPAVDIPPLLKAVNRALLPGGTSHLLLIDPLPRGGTLGRHMRVWLRTNLLPNIERAFRCANPSTLFPEWLAAASLRGKGSTITTTKFYANPASVQIEASAANDQHSTHDDHETRVKKAEIRSLTGRTLWKMIWGSFVSKGSRMWWDDPVCAEECIELGTIWEYHFIEGVKDAEVT